MKTTIQISEINSNGIQAVAARDGITEGTLIGDNGKTGDAKITVYEVGGGRVANTNGDPVWEDEAPEAFAELMETIS